jgi:putative tricarboxylic transport membrane protein
MRPIRAAGQGRHRRLCLGLGRLLLNAGLISTWASSSAAPVLCAGRAGPAPRGHQTHTLSGGLLKDVMVGLAIAAPVFWMFTQFLAINLPGLTETGWL